MAIPGLPFGRSHLVQFATHHTSAKQRGADGLRATVTESRHESTARPGCDGPSGTSPESAGAPARVAHGSPSGRTSPDRRSVHKEEGSGDTKARYAHPTKCGGADSRRAQTSEPQIEPSSTQATARSDDWYPIGPVLRLRIGPRERGHTDPRRRKPPSAETDVLPPLGRLPNRMCGRAVAGFQDHAR